jgi:NitT/TauT family transport system permease protein
MRSSARTARLARERPSKEFGFKVARIVIFYVLLVALWALVAKAEVWPRTLFPAPDRVFESLRNSWESGVLLEALQGTVKRLAIGYAISLVLGMGLGLLVASWKWADETLGGVILGLQSLPSIVWLPMAVLWFGLSERGVIFVVLMGSTFSIAISARAGIRALPPLLSRAAGTLGAARWQLYLYVVLPSMIPSMVQGMKQGWAFAWRSLMAAELLLSIGLGHQLQIGRDLNNISMVFAMMLVIMAVGVVVGLLFSRAESWVQERWGYAAV